MNELYRLDTRERHDEASLAFAGQSMDWFRFLLVRVGFRLRAGRTVGAAEVLIFGQFIARPAATNLSL